MRSSHPYGDLLDAMRPEPPVRHPRMARRERAGQFDAFAALAGYDKAVQALSAELASGELAPEHIDAFVENYFSEVLAQTLSEE